MNEEALAQCGAFAPNKNINLSHIIPLCQSIASTRNTAHRNKHINSVRSYILLHVSAIYIDHQQVETHRYERKLTAEDASSSQSVANTLYIIPKRGIIERNSNKKVKQSRYRPGVAQRVPGS